jgi:hypothetical protein
MKGPQSACVLMIARNIKSKMPRSTNTTITPAKKILIVRSSSFFYKLLCYSVKHCWANCWRFSVDPFLAINGYKVLVASNNEEDKYKWLEGSEYKTNNFGFLQHWDVVVLAARLNLNFPLYLGFENYHGVALKPTNAKFWVAADASKVSKVFRASVVFSSLANEAQLSYSKNNKNSRTNIEWSQREHSQSFLLK